MEISTTRRIHPLIAIAAVSVTLLSLVGIGAITGLIPISHGQSAQTQTVNPAGEPLKSAVAQPAEVAAAATVTELKPADKPVAHKAAPKHAKRGERPRKAVEVPVKAVKDEAPVTVGQNVPPSGYGPPPGYGAPPAAEPPKPICHDCGVIESVREIEKPGQGSGLGAVAGGLVGGLLGRQTGGGHGRDAMTVLGAIGGAIAGNAIEKNEKKMTSYAITIGLEDGSARIITQDNSPPWHLGEKVRLVNGVITARN
jgi:outer membrane lipoprotein SlyB